MKAVAFFNYPLSSVLCPLFSFFLFPYSFVLVQAQNVSPQVHKQAIVLGVNRDSLIQSSLKAQNPLLVYREMVRVEAIERLTRDIRPLKMRDVGLVRDWFEEAEEKAFVDSFQVARFQFISRAQRKWFLETFKDTDWAGAGLADPSRIDTMKTLKLRGMLETAFGAPSSTIFDVPEERRRSSSEHVQFEYYFVANDSIPLMIMDVYGPYQRGLVFAGEYRHRNILPKVKKVLVDSLWNAQNVSEYADYYYDGQLDKWFYVGFDGNSYFNRQIEQPKRRHTFERPSNERPPDVKAIETPAETTPPNTRARRQNKPR